VTAKSAQITNNGNDPAISAMRPGLGFGGLAHCGSLFVSAGAPHSSLLRPLVALSRSALL
jgi:hypothetical protein